MRFTRLLAFATWVVIALLAMAAFAAFSPGNELAELGAPAAAATEDSQPDATIPPGIGAAAGRQAAFAFSQDILSLAVPDTTTTTTRPTTTTTAAPTTTTTAPPAPPPTTSTSTTATTAAPAPPPRTNAPLPPDTVYALIATYFNAEDVEQAMLVAWCESRYDANATHPSSRAAGLFQHLPRYWESRSSQAGIPGADIYDPAANTMVAAWLVYSDGGWKHWNASASCWGNGSVVAPSTTTHHHHHDAATDDDHDGLTHHDPGSPALDHQHHGHDFDNVDNASTEHHYDRRSVGPPLSSEQ